MKIADTSGQDTILQHKSSKKSTLLVSSIVTTVLMFVGFYSWPSLARWSTAESTISESRLRFDQVKRGDFIKDVSVQGRIIAAVSPTLYAPAEGTVTLHAKAGDQVEKGQIMAVIDSPALKNQFKQEDSSLARLKIELDRQGITSKKSDLDNQKITDLAMVMLNTAKREKRRADLAFSNKVISLIDFEKAQDDLENANLTYQHSIKDASLNKESLAFELTTKQFEVERQQLIVNELQRQLDELTIISPVSGIVGNLNVAQKNQVNKNQPVMSVVDLSVFEVEVNIPESYADDLAIGMDAEIYVGNVNTAAKLVSISPEITNNQVIGRIRFNDSPPVGLRQNQRLSTRILMEHRSDVLMVQRGQFLESGGGRIAYVIEDGIANRKAIEIGARSLSSVEILSGLDEGDSIVISSTELFNGSDKVLLTN